MKNIIYIVILLFSFVSNTFATAYDDEPVNSWNDDGYELMNTVNGILKIIKFTNANTHVNQGDYKITYQDPMSGGKQTIIAVLNVTQADANSPMIIKFAIKEDMTANTTRYAYVKVNKSVSPNYPLGDFELTTYALDYNKYISEWDQSTGPYDRQRLIISANSSGQSTVKMIATNKDDGGSEYTTWMNLLVDDADFNSGVASMSDVNISFNDTYIIDTNSSKSVLSSKSTLDTNIYKYKLFNTDGTNIDLGANISSFPFETSNGAWGFIGSNWLADSYPQYSGMYYINNDVTLNINDTITALDGESYTITDINDTTITIGYETFPVHFIKIAQNGTQKNIAPFEFASINGNTYYKSGNVLYPDDPSTNISNGIHTITTNGTDNSYKVKATMIIKSKLVLDTNTTLDGLVSDNNTTKPSLNALKTRLDNNTLSNPNLTYNISDIEEVKTWYDGLDYDSVPMKVVNGVDQ